MRTVAVALCAAGVLFSSGCYTYVPATIETVAPGTSVRFQLTPEGSEAARTAPGIRMSGEVSDVSGNELLLLLRGQPTAGASVDFGARQLRLRPTHVSSFEASILDGRRTALFAAGVGALIGLSFYLVHVRDAGGSTTPPGGGGVFSWVPPLP